MRRTLLLALSLAALPAAARHHSQSFRVGAVVMRSCRVQATSGHLWLSQPALVAFDAAPPRLVAGDIPLEKGALTVTVHY